MVINPKSTYNVLILPFTYELNIDMTYEQIVSKLLNGSWEEAELLSQNNELFEYVESLISKDVRKGIGISLKYNNTEGVADSIYCVNHKGTRYLFKFASIELVIFRSGIGFLLLRVGTDSINTIEELLELNNVIKSIKHGKFYHYKKETIFIDVDDLPKSYKNDDLLHLHYKDEIYNISKQYLIDHYGTKKCMIINKDSKRYVKVELEKVMDDQIDYRKLISEIVSEVKVVSYFNEFYSQSIKAKMANKHNLFCGVFYNERDVSDHELLTQLFRLRKGYSANYIPSDSVISNATDEVISQFDSSSFGISREGVGIVNFQSSEFMRRGFSDRLNNYLYLYIIALHQYYGLLNLARKISKLPYSFVDCQTDEEHMRLVALRSECNIFYLKCIFDEVSHLSHQAIYFGRLRNVLGINSLQKEINYEIDRMTELIETIKHKKEQEYRRETDKKEKEADRRRSEIAEEENRIREINNLRLSIMGGIFAGISVFEVVLNLVILTGVVFKNGKGWNTILLIQIIVSLLIVMVIVFIGYGIFRRRKNELFGRND